MHQQSRREAIAVAFFAVASLILWAGVYGLSRMKHPGKTYFMVWLGLTYLGYMMSAIIWTRRTQKRRRVEPEPEPEFTQMNPPAKLPPARLP